MREWPKKVQFKSRCSRSVTVCILQELIENSVLPKPKKMSASDHEALTKLLVEKDKQLKHTMVVSRLRRFCALIYSHVLNHTLSFQNSWQ